MSTKLILALETSGRYGSVAVLRDHVVLASGKIAAHERTAAALTPLIANTVRSASVQLSELNAVAVTCGPGSFTGLRVGITTAKTLAYALGTDVVGVNTMSVIAHQVPADVPSVCVIIDAQRQQLFSASFQRDPTGRMIEAAPTTIVDNTAWLDSLQSGDVVTGSGLAKLRERLPNDVVVVEESRWEPTANSVGAVAIALLEEGRRDDFWKLVPQYLRQSAAEEKLQG